MNIWNYAASVNWKKIDTDGVYGHQCVDLVKDCIKVCFNIQLGTFWGSAKTGWANTSNTFPDHTWDRIENDTSKPNQIPAVGDVVFFNMGTEWDHTAIVIASYPGENRIKVLEQNTGNGDGQGDDDAVKIAEYSYSKVYGWYHYQMNLTEYKGVPVKFSDAVCTDGATACYIKSFTRIILTSIFYKSDREHQEGVLEHEYAHYVWYQMPKAYQELWILIDNFDPKIQRLLKRNGYNFTENEWVNAYARKNMKESLSESMRFYTVEWKYRNWYEGFKQKVAVALMKKFGDY